VLVNDTQAGRHVSENVQHLGDLWTEANMGGMACCMRDAGSGACTQGRAGPTLHLEGSVVVVQQAARGAVPEVHHEQQVRRCLGAAHADARECVGLGLNGPAGSASLRAECAERVHAVDHEDGFVLRLRHEHELALHVVEHLITRRAPGGASLIL
jgi:hypothetical protein